MSNLARCFEVAEENDGQRLDVFLATQCPDSSRVRIRRGIDERNAQVDGQQRKASYRVQAGQQVEFVLPEEQPTGPEP